MLRGRSWIQRAVVAGWLLISLSASLVALPHASGADADACMATLVQHDEGAHFIGAAPTSSSTGSQHCLLCHSLRSLGFALEQFQQRQTILAAERLHPATLDAEDRIEWSLVLGRAPPSASTVQA